MLDDIKASGGTDNLALERERFLPLLRRSFAAHGIFLHILAGYMLFLGCLFVLFPDLPAKFAPEVALIVLQVIATLSMPVLIACKPVEMAVYEAPARPALRLFEIVLSLVRNAETWAKGLPMFLCLCLFMFVFGHVKAGITLIQPFVWDETFDRWDVALHVGYRPWELLQPVLGYPPVTFLVSINYSIWFLILIAFWTHYAFVARPGEQRTRFYLSFMLSWIIGGSLFAILLSSAGPCYYGKGGLGLSPDPYAGLMAYLESVSQSVPIGTLGVQAFLWDKLGETMPFGGISAMPSMHNASALLFVLASRGSPRWLRWPLVIHCGLVYLGSIHLGWHYAVDAYLAWAITLAVWYAAGPLSRWWESRPAALAFRLALESPRGA
jgi:hypothetical protein